MKAIYLNLDYCIGCNACEVACERVKGRSRVVLGKVRDEAVLPLHCRQCEQPACVAACYTGALKRENGIIVMYENLCTGCRSCILACPSGAIPTGITDNLASKCDLCKERLARGKKPACVATCPTRALVLRDVDEKEENLLVAARMLSKHPTRRRL